MAIDDNTSYELTGYQVKDLASKVRAKADSSSLASVATSGLYSDLTGAPTIPTVYNGTLTVTQGGNTLGTFTANQSSNATIDIPTGGSTYTAGNGINISVNDEISIDTSVVAELSDLPTVNDGTLTIQHNGTTKGTFTANQSTASTVNIETIYADDYISTSPIPTTVTTAMIENGAVTTAKIDDEAVTASKVDPTSFAVLMYVGEIAFVKQTYNNSLLHLTDKIDFYAASNVGAVITSSTDLVMTLPTDGSYIARVKASLWTNGNSWDYMLFAIRKNGNGFARAMGPKISGAWGFVNAEGYTTIANEDALSVYLNTNGNNFSDGNITGQDSKLIVEIYKVG